jgi:pSer/pThr/pTyr-binding forkhead associated (FHA) protein
VPAPPPVAPVQAPPRSTLAPSQLVVAASGAALPLPNAAQAIVGRGDPVSNFFPDIDLNSYGALDNGVGRRHIRLFIQGGQLMLEDLDSTNGTVLNGQKLAAHQPQPLRNGDQIIVGKQLLRFQL